MFKDESSLCNALLHKHTLHNKTCSLQLKSIRTSSPKTKHRTQMAAKAL